MRHPHFFSKAPLPRARLAVILAGGLFVTSVVFAGPARAQDTTTSSSKKSAKKSAKKRKKKTQEEVAPPPVPAPASTHTIESLLKKEEEAEEPTRLAPAELPGRGGQITKDDKADKARDDAIAQLLKIIPKQRNPAVLADLYFQLAELWWEKSRYVNFNQEIPALQAEQEKWHNCLLKLGAKHCYGEPRLNNRKSELYRANAVALYQKIIKDYPQYERVDEIRFDLAYDMSEMASLAAVEGKKAEADKLYKQAVDAYKSLIALNPKSGYVTDSLVELGNYYFDHNDLDRATKAFTDAYNRHNKRTENYALYKLAWCRYNQGDYADSVRKFKEVVERSEHGKDEKIKLKGEALRDLVLAFTKNGERDSAIKYYQQKAGREGAVRYIIMLAGQFFEAGGAQYDDAIKTYQWLMNEKPNDSHAPEWQSKVVLSYDKKGNRQKVREEIKRLVEKYGRGGSWWPQQKEEPRRLALDLTEEALYNLATDYHQEALKTRLVATFRLAADIYKEYNDNFPDNERAYQMRFYYAEILYTLEDFQTAYEQYRKVVDDPSQKNLRSIAARDMLLSAQKLIQIDDGIYVRQITPDTTVIEEKKAKGDKGEIAAQHIKEKIDKAAVATDLTPHEKQVVEACDYYAKVIPDADDESTVRLFAAVIYFDHHQYVEAANRFGYIIQKWPEEASSRTAAVLILEALESKQEWETLNKRAREFAQNKKLLEGEKKEKDFKTHLQEYIENSQFKLAEALQGKDDAKAASEFSTYMKEFPKSKYAPIAGYNAFLAYQKAKELDTAITVGQKILSTWPNADSDDMRHLPGSDPGTLRPPILPDLTFRVAKTYELTADFAKAAEYYEIFAKDYPFEKQPTPKDKELTTDAIFNAAYWYRGLGEDAKAIDAYQRYIKLEKPLVQSARDELKMVPDAALTWTICQIYEDEKNWEKFTECAEKTYLKDYTHEPKWQVFNTKYHEFLAYLAQNEDAKATDLAKWMAEYYKVYLSADDKARDTSKLAIAHTQFYLLEPEFQKYAALKFRNGVPWRLPQYLKEDLAAITSAGKALAEKYTTVVAYGNGDWGIAALVRIGMLPRLFANMLRAAPIPKNLDADQTEMYRGQLEDSALQKEEPAITLLQKAIQKSFELGIYNEWTIKAEEALGEFKPELVGPVHKLDIKGSTFFFTATDGPANGPRTADTSQPSGVKAPAQAGSGGGDR